MHMVGAPGIWEVGVLGWTLRAFCQNHQGTVDLRFVAARLHILAQFVVLSWRPLGDMEHTIVGLFLCNLSLFVTRIAVFTCIWCCTVGSGCSVCTGLLFLCKKSHSLQQFCYCTSFLRSVFLHNVLIDTSPCARVVCQLLAQVFQQ